MKEIIKEEIKKYIVYKSFDGMEFSSQNECEKYENSAVGVILNKIYNIAINTMVGSHYNFLDCNEENNYLVVVPQSESDIEVINQFLYLKRPIKENSEFLIKNSAIGKVLMVGYKFYDDTLDWNWCYDLNKMIEDITNNQFSILKK